MTPPRDPAGDLADVRALIAEVAAEAASVAAAVAEFDQHVDLLNLVRLVRQRGFEEGRAEVDPHAADARARKARAEFKVLPGGKAVAPAKAAPRPRKSPGGAA